VRTLKAFLLLLVLAAAAGAWLVTKYRIDGLENISLSRKGGAEGSFSLPPAKVGETIRVASFNIQVFGTDKLSDPRVVAILARIIRQFDVVAVQEIRSQEQDLMARFVEIVNSEGRSYNYVIGPRLGNSDSKEQYAFIFDQATVEIEPSQLYTLTDPDNLLHREPLVGWFRARGPAPSQAFTFSLVNIHTDPDVAAEELDLMDDVLFTVRDDGREEDDVILLGDFNADDQHLGELAAISGIQAAIVGAPTNTRKTKQYDNLVFHTTATKEYTGRSGVFDFMREYNLTLDDALLVSDHLPVWAEFTVFEGGQPGRIAEAPRTRRY
jgi:endonuclease/exonuclease/phosphatase family metal-dependent hydrolase